MIYPAIFIFANVLFYTIESFHTSTLPQSSFYQYVVKSAKQSHRLKLSSQDTTIAAKKPSATDTIGEKKELARTKAKQAILRAIGARSSTATDAEPKVYDLVLADPETKEPVCVTAVRTSRSSVILADQGVRNSGVSVTMQSEGSNNVYIGRTDTYYNLLNPVDEADEVELSNTKNTNILLRSIQPLLPFQIRQSIIDQDYIPMRDLFTSPFVSFAYERGWRNSFAAAGFPGIEKESELVRDFFRVAIANNPNNVVVDMSCATGLMTRRLAKSKEYNRVIGCDYSDSMLAEARRRISASNDISGKVELIQCDVAKIPMQDGSIDALHAGAAMHCWPDVQQGLNEIYRVIKPNGGRYFATTFLSKYMKNLQNAESGVTEPGRQAFQYFKDTDELRLKLVNAGFDDKNVLIEVIGEACVVMRCEK